MPSRSAARHTSSGSPTGSAAATSNNAGLLRQRVEPLPEALLDPPRQRLRAQQPEPARQLRRGQPPRQLEQRQRIPLVSATIRSRTRSSSRNRTTEPNSARASPLRSPRTSSSGSPRSSSPGSRAANSSPTDSANNRRATNAKRPRRRPVQPLRVIHHAHQRTLLRRLREQAQHRQPDQKPIRRRPRISARTRPPAPRAADPEAVPDDRASARTTDARQRTPTPSQTPRPLPAPPADPTPPRPRTPTAPSSRPRPRPGPPACGSRPSRTAAIIRSSTAHSLRRPRNLVSPPDTGRRSTMSSHAS